MRASVVVKRQLTLVPRASRRSWWAWTSCLSVSTSAIRRSRHCRLSTESSISVRLRRIEPATVLGRVVDLELVRESLGLLRGEGLVERGGRVGVQVVEDQDDPVSIGMADVDEVLDQPCPVLPGAVIGDGQVSGAQQGLAEAEDVGHTVASVLVVEALGQTGQRGQGRADLADQLLGHLSQTDQRTLRIEGSGVDVEDILHMVDELGVRLGRNHPLLLAPGSKLVCLSL